jgi:nitrite reductase/ring-hydroxylating ferredoxin subunit
MPQADGTVNTPRREQRAARRNRGTDDYCVNVDERLSAPRASANLNDSCEFAAPMTDCWVDRGRVVCPWHGSWFDLCSGEVLPGSVSGQLVDRRRAKKVRHNYPVFRSF